MQSQDCLCPSCCSSFLGCFHVHALPSQNTINDSFRTKHICITKYSMENLIWISHAFLVFKNTNLPLERVLTQTIMYPVRVSAFWTYTHTHTHTRRTPLLWGAESFAPHLPGSQAHPEVMQMSARLKGLQRKEISSRRELEPGEFSARGLEGKVIN